MSWGDADPWCGNWVLTFVWALLVGLFSRSWYYTAGGEFISSGFLCMANIVAHLLAWFWYLMWILPNRRAKIQEVFAQVHCRSVVQQYHHTMLVGGLLVLATHQNHRQEELWMG